MMKVRRIEVFAMKYCPSCQRIIEGDREYCPICSRLLQNELKDNAPVFLISCGGFEKERIEAALEDQAIPYSEKMPKKERSAKIVTGDRNYQVNLFVPYSALETAKEILVGIGAEVPKEGTETPRKPQNAMEEEFDEMSRGKRMLWRIISIVLFIAIVFGLVTGIDYVMDLLF